jgi:UDP-N-acetylmuramoylalanine--D-glutamate ligase
MIPVQGVENQTIAVLGLGRSGRATAAALTEGGANVVVWDDGADTRAQAEADGMTVLDLTRDANWDGISALITSPGIPHLYPKPHPVIAKAYELGVPVDNDIGLFFRSFATRDWDMFDTTPRVIAITGSNGKSTTTALIHHILESAAARPRSAAISAPASCRSTPPMTARWWCWNSPATRPIWPAR